LQHKKNFKNIELISHQGRGRKRNGRGKTGDEEKEEQGTGKDIEGKE
jgi:hypothetical protein